MNTPLKTLIAAMAAGLMGGCAGGGGERNAVEDFLETLFCASLGLPANCGELAEAHRASAATSTAAPSTAAPSQASTVSSPRPEPFIRWEDHSSTKVQAGSLNSKIDYNGTTDGSIGVTSTGATIGSSSTTVGTGRVGEFLSYENQGQSLAIDSRKLPGQPGLASAFTGQLTGNPRSPFLDWKDPDTPHQGLTLSSIGVVSDPKHLGWSYQSFGIWNDQQRDSGSLGASSFGAATIGSAIPASGTATFTGKLAGFYVSPAAEGSIATADLTVNANFSARSLSFASSGTTLTRDLSAATSAPHLNVNGTLMYSAGSNSFSGTLTNAGGTMIGMSKGRFYGPSAQELGGVFTVKSPSTVETLTGAYGAKR